MTGRWFSPGPLASSTNKTDCQDITEILLKVTFKHKKNTQTYFTSTSTYSYDIFPLSVLFHFLSSIFQFWTDIFFFIWSHLLVWRVHTRTLITDLYLHYLYFNFNIGNVHLKKCLWNWSLFFYDLGAFI